MQCTGTCIVSPALKLIHGNFEDAFDEFFQRFAKLLDVYQEVLPYVFAKDGDTASVEVPGCQGAPFQSVLQIHLEFFAFIDSCLVIIFHLIVVADNMELVNSEFTS